MSPMIEVDQETFDGVGGKAGVGHEEQGLCRRAAHGMAKTEDDGRGNQHEK